MKLIVPKTKPTIGDVDIDHLVHELRQHPHGAFFGHVSSGYGGASLWQEIPCEHVLIAEGSEIWTVLGRLCRILGCELQAKPNPMIDTRTSVWLVPLPSTLWYDPPYDAREDEDSEVGES